MQGSFEVAEVVYKEALSFKHVLATFPFNCQAAAPEDISPHLCFICLLHLANEHGLSIQDRPSLDDLSFHLPIHGKAQMLWLRLCHSLELIFIYHGLEQLSLCQVLGL
ncbi:hypothetical protein CRYUN_Cryun11dG0016200 [Craigia yunnanensis]